MDSLDGELLRLAGGVAGVLALATVIGRLLTWWVRDPMGRRVVANLNARIVAWWVMCGLFSVALFTSRLVSVALFGIAALLALRELMTLAPTRRADHRALLWSFFVIAPLQFVLVATGRLTLLGLLIPVAAFLLIPVWNALAGDCSGYLERTAVIQWGLMACIYNVSFVPALLYLEIPGYAEQNAKLLLFFVLVVQANDVLQYIWGVAIGRRRIVPAVSPNKTWEGFVGGVACTTLLGTALWWATPFAPWQAAIISCAIALLGFAGDLTMSAIKRDRGVKDYSSLVRGHGGVLDRLDSVCFAAPVFFYMTRYLFA